ncbi:aminotransferase class iii [Holotrichia oblita]|nr:aminotransferase class iii [Holotrichia oblita]
MKKTFVVIGLGRFGLAIVKTLSELKCDVLAIDVSEERVSKASAFINHCVICDSTKKESLKELAIGNVDYAIVAIGNNLQATVLTTINLSDLGVKNITVRADDEEHIKIMEKLGATHVMIPEVASAKSLANQLVHNSFLDYYNIDSEHGIVQIKIPERFRARTLAELDARNRRISMRLTDKEIKLVNEVSANNYKPLPVVLCEGEGIWVKDVDGNRYIDMLSAYSSLNQGHRHPKIIKALKDQADKITITSRAFHNDKMGTFLKKLCDVSGFSKALPMNTGAEAVETAIKAARKWAFEKKGITEGEIIACMDNFHGRTVTVISFSSEPQYREGFGPFTPGFKLAPYGDLNGMEKLINDKTIAIILEPIQGEAGVVVPPQGYLKGVRQLCDKHGLLMIVDEIQTGFCRTGKMFAFMHEGIRPDVMVVGKALGGGVYPVSAMLSNDEVMDVFRPGDHGSTFGGNPLGAAVGLAALQVLEDENLAEKAHELGTYFMQRVKEFNSPIVKEVRGKGLLIAVEVKPEYGAARIYCEKLMGMGILCKETHGQIIRFAPPLIIKKEELDYALEKVKECLKGASCLGADLGPKAIRCAGLVDAINGLGYIVRDCGDINPSLKTIDSVPGSVRLNNLKLVNDVNAKLYKMVKETLSFGNFPLVCGGDHSLAAGSVTAVQRHFGKIGIIWVDAHGDFNNEESSPSGNIHGTPLSAICGGGPENILPFKENNAEYVSPRNTVIIGARALDDEEKRLLKQAGVTVFGMDEIDRRGISSIVEDAIKIASADTEGIYLSFDLDAVDPFHAPGVGTPVKGGLTYREAHYLCEQLFFSDKLLGCEIVELNPILDLKNETGEFAVSLACSMLGKTIL